MATQDTKRLLEEAEKRRRQQEEARKAAQSAQDASASVPQESRPQAEQENPAKPTMNWKASSASMNGTNWKQNSRHFTGMQTSVGKKVYDPTTGKTAYTFDGIENIGEKTRDAISPMIKEDAERQAFVKQANESIERRKQNQSNMQALSGLYDANGNAINANTADLTLMVQGIRSIADSGKREKAADALETLTKTQGSRFYGQTIDKTLAKTYLASPEFDEAKYKEFVSELDGAFWPQSGHEAENREAYQGFLEEIESKGYDERIARQLRATLDEAYQNATGAAYAGDEPMEQTEQTPGDAAAQEQNAGEEKQTGILESIFGALTETAQPYGFRGDSDKDAKDGAQGDGVDALTSASAKREANPQEQANPGFLDTLANAMQGKLVDDSYFEQRQGGANEQTPEEAPEETQETGPIGYTKTGTVASATASDVLPPLPGYKPKEKTEAQGPQQREYRTIESDADVVAAYLGGWYDEIAPKDRETFERWMNSTSAKAVLGVVSDEREINLALSDNGAPELTLMEGTGIGALGMTAYAAREMILGEDFPQELRSYGLTMLTMLGARADQYAQEGTLGGDEGLPNLERLLQTDEESRAQLDAIYAARDELTRNMQDARREHEEASAKSLADARAAVLSGQYSDEQLLLVQENAPEAGWKEITADQTRAQMAAQVEFIDEGYFAPGGGFEQSAVRAGLDASGVVSDDNYRLALADKMTVILNEDTQTALSLGLSLEEYYSRVGGMDMDTLCQRAATRMSREGESFTQEDAEALTYGSGMGGAVIAAYGIAHGVKYFYGSYADSLYIGMTEADVTRNAARMAMQYQQDYGMLAGTQYKKDLQALIDSGDLMEGYGEMIASMMEEADNIFAIGIDPEAHPILRGVGSESRSSRKAMEKQVATYGTESENKWFYRTSGMTSNALQAVVASAGTKLTGSSNIGFFLGYDVMSYGERMNARLAEGYKRGSAGYLAAIDTAGSHLANVGTFEGIYGRMTGTGSLHTAAAADLLAGNPVGAAKGLSAIKRYAWAGLKSFAASEFDEAFTDEMKEGLAQSGVDPTVEIDAAKRARGEVETDSEQTQMQFALVGRTEDGKGIYTSNYSPNTPKQVKIDRLVDLWQTVWSRKPLEMTVTNADGSTRTVTANFDPDYDPENKKFTDLGKVVHNRNGSGGDRTVTLNLADDLYDIASGSKYVDSENEYGKNKSTHQDVNQWHYFSNDFVYRDGETDTPMTLWLDLKEKDDGGWVYQLYAKKTKNKEEAPSSPMEISHAKGEETSSVDNSVAQSGTAVNPHSMQDSGKQYAVGDVGFRMFGNETAQRLDTLTQTVKDALKGTTYEKDTNAEQVDRAQKIIDRDGLSETIDSLLTKSQEEWSADEHALGALCMVLANQPGRVDPIRAMAIAQVYNEAGTKAGKALQVRQIVGKLTPSGAMLGTVQNAKDANKKKGIGGNAIPMGNEAPKGKNRKRAGKSGTTVAPMEDGQGSFTVQKPAQIVEDIYDKADRTYADLSALPQDVSRDNPWGIPLNPAQMALIRQFGLMGEKLPGANYSRASLNQRMLAAIISTPNNVRGDGLLTLCQQLHAMKQGLAVVTEADLSYIAGQASEVMAQGVTEAGTPATAEGRIAMKRMYDTQANTVPATFGQKLTALSYDNMLSAPATWVRNVASNVLVAPLEKVSTWIASAADAAVAKRTGTRTTAYTTKEERAAGRDAAVQEVVNTVRDHFVTHTDTSHGSKYDKGDRGRTFQNAWLDVYDNIVRFAMQIGDRPFYEACYAEELAVIKRLGMKVRYTDADRNAVMRDMTAKEMHDEATMRALERVFQEDSAVVNWLNSAPAGVSFLLRSILPFRKTPMNIAKRMFQYSPYGLAKTLLVDGLYEAKVGNNFNQRKFVMGVGRGLTGTGMMVAGYILGAAGLLGSGRSDEEDDKLRAMRTALGEPYSMYLKLGDMDVEIEWGLPSAAGLVFGAKLSELWKEAVADGTLDGNDMTNILIGIFTDSAELLFDNTWLSAIRDLFRGYDDAAGVLKRIATTTAENATNQTFSPAFFRAMAKAIDPYVRDTSSDNFVMEMLNSCVIQYWPGLRQTLPIKTDITGDKALQSGYYNWGKEHQNAALHFLNTFLTPTMPIGEKNDAAILELVDLSYRTGETGFLPGTLVTSSGKLNLDKDSAKKLGLGDGKHVYPLSLNAEETRRANELYGNILFNGTQGVKYPKAGFGNFDQVDGLRALMESREWARATDEERMEKVKKMQSAVKEIVAVQMARGQME